MKTILVTGGTDGIGKGLVLQYLKEGHKVFAVGRSPVKGNGLLKEAQALGKKDNLIFIPADLSLVEENNPKMQHNSIFLPLVYWNVICL